jgi:hypothetical protein
VRLLAIFACAACGFDPRAATSDGPVSVDHVDAIVTDAPASVADAKAADAMTPFCDPNDATLVACYEFEDALTDGSKNHLDPNVMVDVSYGAGKVGSALVVGSNTEVDVAENSLFGVAAVTIEAWINPVAIPTDRGGILDCDGRYGFFLYANDDVECLAGGGTASAGPIPTGQWTHVACTDDGATLRVYLNGKLAGSAASSALSRTGSMTGITLGGNNPPGGGNPLGGSLDELRLFGSARTAAQICADSTASECD